jgi:hypothetical protein
MNSNLDDAWTDGMPRACLPSHPRILPACYGTLGGKAQQRMKAGSMIAVTSESTEQ